MSETWAIAMAAAYLGQAIFNFWLGFRSHFREFGVVTRGDALLFALLALIPLVLPICVAVVSSSDFWNKPVKGKRR